MRIVFLGTPEFAVASLDLLLKNKVEIAAVVTAPDKPAGRGRQMQYSAVKIYALANGLRVLQPERLKEEKFLQELRDLDADLFIVVAFRMLPEQVWNMPRLGTYNLHGSLLPKYRGAAPINWAVINGEEHTGVTTFRLVHQIDCGNILFQERIVISPEDNAGTLHDKMMITGAQLLVKTVLFLEECERRGKQPEFREQDETEASHAPKIFKETCRIRWGCRVNEIHNLVRGLSPYPGAFTVLCEGSGRKNVKILKTAVCSEMAGELTNGSLLTDNSTWLKVACADGVLGIEELQIEGKKRMDVRSFLRGYKFEEDARFEPGPVSESGRPKSF